MNEFEKFKNQTMRKHLSEDNIHRKIYKIIPFDILFKIFQNKKNVFVKTKTWDDPYENFLFKLPIYENNIVASAENQIEQIFGQSWSFEEESEALWRIYSKDKRGVQIQTTIHKLWESIYVDEYSSTSTYIGEIEYKNYSQLSEWTNDVKSNSFDIYKYIDSLFIKRNIFDYEKELRVIYYCDSFNEQKEKDLKEFSIEPLDLIESIVVDPRCSDESLKMIQIICDHFEYPENKVRKSTLYDFSK